MGLFVKAVASPFKLYNAISDEIAKERRIRLQDGQLWSSLFGRESSSGKTVTIDSALQLSTVWACVKVNAQAVASLGLHCFEKQRDGGRERVDNALADVLADSPNQDQTPLEFWEGVVAWLLVSGNAYAEKVTTGRNLSALEPIMSTHCRPYRNGDGELSYKVTDRGKEETLPREKIFHIKGFGSGLMDRDSGLSAVRYGVQSMGAAMAAEEAAGKMFGNGMHASGVLSSDQVLKAEQRGQLQKMMEAYTGSSKAGKLMVLEAGLKYEQLSMNPEDAQMLETRRFSIEEMCRWFGTPPIIIGHSADGQTMWGTGVEAILISWLTTGVDPICDRIEASIKKHLIRPTGNRRLYAEFNREALLQMDSTAKANFLSTMWNSGGMTRNEGRAKLNLPRDPSPVADQLTVQSAMLPIDKLGANVETQARSALMSWLGINQEGKRDEQA